MAALHSLLSDRPLKTEARNSPESLLNFLLAGRYQVTMNSQTEALQVLKALDKWKDYKRRFEKRAKENAA
jgi:hypothetical protein